MKKIRVYVAGHNGMVGSAIVRCLQKEKNKYDLILRNKKELDLTDQTNVRKFFLNETIDQVYIAAAKVGGIYANNKFPSDFLYENLMIQSNIIHESWKTGVKKILFLGSSCIYPKLAQQPIREEYLLTGPLEPTNEPYAIAKIAGIKLCESYTSQYGKSHGIDYRSLMPTNLYGVGDNYHLKNSHVIPALLRKFHEAKINKSDFVKVWGSGNVKREFLYVDDLAKACLHIMNLTKEEFNNLHRSKIGHINVGSGHEISIKDLANEIKYIVGFEGDIHFDSSKPEGTPLKYLDSSSINKSGWSSEISLRNGLKYTYSNFAKNYQNIINSEK